VSVRLFYDPHRVEQLRQQGIDPHGRPAREPAAEMRSAIVLVEENARLRAEVKRLTAEVARLRGGHEELPADDAAQRFKLPEDF
jgi:cell division protein FtsB